MKVGVVVFFLSSRAGLGMIESKGTKRTFSSALSMSTFSTLLLLKNLLIEPIDLNFIADTYIISDIKTGLPRIGLSWCLLNILTLLKPNI